MATEGSKSQDAVWERPGRKVAQPASGERPGFSDVTEQKRLNEARETGVPWKKWGPYLALGYG